VLTLVTPAVTRAQDEPQPLAQYRCVTADMVGFSTDENPGFVAANLEKTYEIMKNGDEIFVFMHTDIFEDGEYRYKVFYSDYIEVIALNEDGTDRIVLPADPEGDEAEDGYFQVTISQQSRLGVNSWLLRCVS
jgi:hypothetical protein